VLEDGFDSINASDALKLLKPYRDELLSLPLALLVNCYFGPADAAFYWAFIRLRRPTTIIEIGSGYSSRIAQRALDKNSSGRLFCIDPSPRLNLPTKNLTHVKAKVEDIELSFFDRMKPHDILFIDSSHTGDEARRHEAILDRLPVGTLVHYHDIDYPWDRPSPDWDEDSVLAAFLETHVNWKVVVSGSLLSRDYLQQLREIIPNYKYCPYRRYNAIWMLRTF